MYVNVKHEFGRGPLSMLTFHSLPLAQYLACICMHPTVGIVEPSCIRQHISTVA